MMTAENLWIDTLEEMKKKISKPSYQTWLETTKAHSLQDEKLVVTARSVFERDFLESNYSHFIMDIMQTLTGTEVHIKFIVEEEEKLETSPTNHKDHSHFQHSTPRVNLAQDLNRKYTFDSFVVGAGNRFAHAASLAVAEAPAKAYNPLFIYGGVGLGKTHLMQAIGQYIIENQPKARVVYTTSEKFTNEFINAILDNKTSGFRDKYRNVDILLIDDIQFLAKKEQTQEEFFHTFNSLHEDNKQIVISSDRPPKEIPTLEARLRSRFEWGLITDITPPDLETRIAILRKKAKAENLDIPNEVMAYIASQINTNIRELEGALIRVVAYSSLVNADIDYDLSVEALKNIIPNQKQNQVTIERIQEVTAQHFGVTFADLKAKKRTRVIAYPRQIAMYLSRELTHSSLPKIGQEFGGRDHTTVMHACDKIRKLIAGDAQIHQTIQNLIDHIKN